MERIIDARGTHKTRKLLQAASVDPNSLIVCSNPNSMHKKALAYGIAGLRFMSYVHYVQGQAPHDVNIYVDELEGLIREFEFNAYGFVGVTMKGYSLTNED